MKIPKISSQLLLKLFLAVCWLAYGAFFYSFLADAQETVFLRIMMIILFIVLTILILVGWFLVKD